MNQNKQCLTPVTAQDAGKRVWIYIHVHPKQESRYNMLESELRAYASKQKFSLKGCSVDIGSRKGCPGMAQMLKAAKESVFDILLIKSLEQLNISFPMSLHIMTSLEKQGVQIWSPGHGKHDIKKMSVAYDLERFFGYLEERRYSRERRECYSGDCVPEDYDGDDCPAEIWDKRMVQSVRRG